MSARHRPPRWLPAVALPLALALVAGCGDDRDEAQRQEGPFAVGTRRVTFVDESRPTAAAGDQPELPSRTIDTELWYPAEGRPAPADRPDAPPADGPFPLVVFSHGQSGEPQQYAPVFHGWAEAGYVVAAPRHPLTVGGTDVPTVSTDVFEQPEDLSFVIDRLAEEEDDLVDVDHLAVAGHSSGATTALAAGMNTCCHDERVDAVVLEAVLEVPFPDGRYFADELPETPVLFLHGEADGSFPIADARAVFEEAEAPKFFLTIDGGSHSDPYRAGPPDPALVVESVVAFLDRYLKERDGALDDLRRAVGRFPFGELDAVEG